MRDTTGKMLRDAGSIHHLKGLYLLLAATLLQLVVGIRLTY